METVNGFSTAYKKYKREAGTKEIFIIGLLLFFSGFSMVLYAANFITTPADKICQSNVQIVGDLFIKLSVGCLIALLVNFLKEYSKVTRNIDKFEKFFGTSGIVNKKGMPAVMIKINPTPGYKYNVADAPDESIGSKPKNISGFIPVDEIEGAMALQELFVSFGAGIEIMTTENAKDYKPELTKGVFALGLGFNKVTKILSDNSGDNDKKLFEILYKDFGEKKNIFRSDTYQINYFYRNNNDPYTPPKDGAEHALIARILYPIDKDKYVPCFVCAGLTAKATTLSCLYLKDHWERLYQDCLELASKESFSRSKTFQMNYAWSIEFAGHEKTRECKVISPPRLFPPIHQEQKAEGG